jgi:hypothetical protein
MASVFFSYSHATETMGNAKYPLELLLRVTTVSLETNKIVASLPALDIDFSDETAPSSLPNR